MVQIALRNRRMISHTFTVTEFTQMDPGLRWDDLDSYSRARHAWL
ncbi:MAG: hypothetical protein V4495_16215 [Pseudomonadota bacterium]